MMIAIENAKVVLEHGVLFGGTILVENDRIVAVGKTGDVSIPADAQRVDAKGSYVGPGFVDIHVHGGNGAMFEVDPEKAAAHFLSHGETTILATLYYTLSKQEFPLAIERVKAAMERGGAAKAIAGFYMEGPYMNPKYGASPEKNNWRGDILREDYQPLLDGAGDLAKVWAVAPEREGIEGFVADAKQANPKTVFAVGHSEATPAQVEKLKRYGIGLQTHCMNATGRIGDRGGIRGSGPDEACLLDSDIYAEIICDSGAVHVCEDNLQLVLKVKGVDKVLLITDSFVTEGEASEKFRGAEDLSYDSCGRLCGSKLTMDVACRNLMTHTNCGIAQAFLLASRNPARAIGMDREIGTIEVGKKANLVFVDDMFHVKKVMLEGVFQP